MAKRGLISPSSNVQFVDKLEYGKDIVFTDKKHGWIIRNKQRSAETILLNTTDGETPGSFFAPETGVVTAMSFVSSQQGWIMAKGDLSRGSEEKSLFRTSNNGGLWKRSCRIRSILHPVFPARIPRTGSIIGLTFTDSLVGFATIREMQSSKLYITRDGGQKWKSSGQIFKSKSQIGAVRSLLAPQVSGQRRTEAKFIYRLPA